MIEHEEVRAALEIATVEPGGLDRLAAGDTTEAAALAGHLAGCPGCMDELTRLRRADMLLRPVLATVAPPELRARTLAFVAAVGRERGTAVGEPDTTPVPAIVPPSDGVGPGSGVTHVAGIRTAAPRAARRAAWPAAVAAALVIGLGGGFLVAGSRPDLEVGNAAVAFTEVSRESTALLAAPDAARATLWDTAGAARGNVVVARSEGRMVAVATDLPDPGAGHEYRCWVEVAGSRKLFWTMLQTGSVAWWSGPAALPASLGPGTRFGVSLVTVGSSGPGEPVLTGGL